VVASRNELYAWTPDVIYFGGLSSLYTPEDVANWVTLVGLFRTNVPGVEIVLGSATRAKPESSAFVQAVAASLSTGYFDAYGAYVAWIAAAGVADADMLIDVVHFHYKGYEVASRALAWWFGASKP
jgi:hypothetical protein